MVTRKDKIGDQIQKNTSAVVTKVDSDNEGFGSFEALVSVFGNEDFQGDKVLAGAFAESIAGGKVFPVMWSHQFLDDTAILGSFTAEETKDGLLIKAEFFGSDRAQNIRSLMQKGLIKEFSWSGRVAEGAWVETEDDWWYEIRKVELWEAGPCFIGANPETQLLGIKSGIEYIATKEGRVLAQKHVNSLKDIANTLTSVITAVEKTADDIEDDSAAESKTANPVELSSTPVDGSTIQKIKARLALSE